MKRSTHLMLCKIANEWGGYGDPAQAGMASYAQNQWENASPEQRDSATRQVLNIPSTVANAASGFFTRDLPQAAVWLVGAGRALSDPANSVFTARGFDAVQRQHDAIGNWHNRYMRVPYVRGTTDREREYADNWAETLSVAGQIVGSPHAPVIRNMPWAVRVGIPWLDDAGNGLSRTGAELDRGIKDYLSSRHD